MLNIYDPNVRQHLLEGNFGLEKENLRILGDGRLSHPLNAEERFQVLETTIKEIVPGNKLNLLIHDGHVLYAHTNYRNSLYISRKENEVYFSTRPLHFGHWDLLPMNTLIACENGRLLKSGTAHQHEFFDDAEKMRLLFLDYSGL